jgi:hypothetical protein
MVFSLSVCIEKGKPIEDLMNDKEKQLTGLAKLSAKELANLNEWLAPDKVLVPDPMFT